MACSVIRLGTGNDDRELRRDSDFGLAPGAGRRLHDGHAGRRELSGSEDQPIQASEVDFRFEGQRLRGLEQNPKTSSRWAQLAREGKKVMQFLSDRRYIASVVDGKVQFYGRGGDRGLNGLGRK